MKITDNHYIKSLVAILFVNFFTTNLVAQNPNLVKTWYIIQVINDFEPIPFTQPETITEVASITISDTSDPVNITGFSGCNTFQVQGVSFQDFGDGSGRIGLADFSSEMNYCSAAYDSWEGRFYWMLNTNEIYYYLHSQNGVDYLDLENPLFSGIYMQSQPLSVTQNNNAISKIRVYPNPTTDKLFISGIKTTIQSLTIRNIHGQKVKEIKTKDRFMNVSELSKGLYFLDIVSLEGTIVKKFIKK